MISGKSNDKFPDVQVANADNELVKALNLPEGFVPISGTALGYPTEPLITERELKQTIKINTIR